VRDEILVRGEAANKDFAVSLQQQHCELRGVNLGCLAVRMQVLQQRT
jgi:hypothetical protein